MNIGFAASYGDNWNAGGLLKITFPPLLWGKPQLWQWGDLDLHLLNCWYKSALPYIGGSSPGEKGCSPLQPVSLLGLIRLLSPPSQTSPCPIPSLPTLPFPLHPSAAQHGAYLLQSVSQPALAGQCKPYTSTTNFCTVAACFTTLLWQPALWSTCSASASWGQNWSNTDQKEKILIEVEDCLPQYKQAFYIHVGASSSMKKHTSFERGMVISSSRYLYKKADGLRIMLFSLF